MNIFLVISMVLLTCLNALAEHPFDYRFEADVKGHHIEVILKLKSFDETQHRLEKKSNAVYIDGLIPIGTDNSFSAYTEFSRFEVRWDKQSVPIPKSYYADLFNVSLSPKTNPVFDPDGSIWSSASADGQSVLIEFQGSEAGGAYKAWIIIRRDGKHSRFIENTTP